MTVNAAGFNRERALRCARLAKLVYETDDQRLLAGVRTLGYDHVRRYDHDGTDTQAIMVFGKSESVFVPRGTERSARDILTDLKFRREDLVATDKGFGSVHRGFRDAWRSIAPGVLVTLAQLAGQGVPVIAAGHSLGGAIAILAALESNGIIRRAVTFGAPRVGDRAFGAWCRRRFEHDRIVRGADAVPLLPLLTMGFAHDRPSVYIGPDGALQPDTGLLAEAWGRARSLAVLDWTRAPVGFGFGPFQFLPERAVTDHLIDGYIGSLERTA